MKSSKEIIKSLIGKQVINVKTGMYGTIDFYNSKDGSKPTEDKLENYISVNFEDGKRATFAFPDSFEQYLSLKDDCEQNEEIKLLIEDRKRIEKELTEKDKEKKSFETKGKNKAASSGTFGSSVFPITFKETKKKKAEPVKKDDIVMSKEQENALGIMETGCNVFLTGAAGTGKSVVLKEFIYRNRDKNIMVCAPTGIAAINVEGTTIHKAFGINRQTDINPGDYNKMLGLSVVTADIIVIDEISMCRFDLFEYVIRTIKKAEEKVIKIRKNKNYRKQIIVVGDFYQLPPVLPDKEKEYLALKWGEDFPQDGFAFKSKLWNELDFKTVYLKEVQRQKDDYIYAEKLDLIRTGNRSGIEWFNKNAERSVANCISLYSKNEEVNQKNKEEIDKLDSEERTYIMTKSGDISGDTVAEKELVLKDGMRVMSLVNGPDGYQNGSLGTVAELKDDSVRVDFDNGSTCELEKYKWDVYGYEVQDGKLEKVIIGSYEQIPLKPAYAITIHKSQGQTYEAINLDPKCFSEGQLYVALSRVKSVKGLHLLSNITPKDLKTSEAVRNFYTEITE